MKMPGLDMHGAATTDGTVWWSSTVNGFSMTVATELGDKTFMIAAIMAMRYNRLIVFTGAAGALLVMTVLSVAIGVALPSLLPKQYTHYAAAALFAYFGVKLLQEAHAMPVDGGGENSELAEAEEELAEKLGGGGSSSRDKEGGKRGEGDDVLADDLEKGGESDLGLSIGISGSSGSSCSSGAAPGNHRSNGNSGGGTPVLTPAAAPAQSSEDEMDPSAKSEGTKRAAALALGELSMGSFWISLKKDWPILSQAFIITFLAEWGDRSQIATIAMAAAQYPAGGKFHPLEWGGTLINPAPLPLTLTPLVHPSQPPSLHPCSCPGCLYWARRLHRPGCDWRQAPRLSHKRALSSPGWGGSLPALRAAQLFRHAG
jgi:putative Ca2+/H+ antiporter (TMEM165/GDT1 family)